VSEKIFPNDNWTRVELFRLAHGRLPTKPTDVITQKTLDLFVSKYVRGKLKSCTINLGLLYEVIVGRKVELIGGGE